MTRHNFFRCLLVVIVSSLFAGQQDRVDASEKTLVAFDSYLNSLMKPQDAEVKTAWADGQQVLRVTTGHADNWPGITLPAPDHSWNLSAFRKIVFQVRNIGTDQITVNCRVDSPGGDGQKNSITGHVELRPGEAKEMSVNLQRLLPSALADKLFGMRGYPGGYAKEKGVDTTKITQLIIFINKPKQDHAFQLGTIRATGNSISANWLRMSPETFFPMIDTFGQFVHARWPGKVDSIAALKHDIQAENKALAEHPGPTDWDQYGGWAAGPQLKATGFFYPIKHAGKWWLVDPKGRLFWSHGVDCVGFASGTTPISDREFCYADLPASDSPLARFYGHASWAPHGYYKDKDSYRTYNFTGANLLRKYGDNWKAKATVTAHKRLRNWAMNTIGNWSDSTVYLQHKTPYVTTASSSGAKPIAGSSGYWGKFPDPFDPSFRKSLDRHMQWQKDKTAGDPWCIGYFVDNEIAWGDEHSLAIAALASPGEQAAKKAFLADLRAKYTTIEKLNKVWETDHDSWAALAECRTPPDEEKAGVDLGDFYTKIAEQYFRQCREAVKAVAPSNLYLGCRFAWVNDRGACAAAKYCDVIGYNLYKNSVADFHLPKGVDMPAIIGEFHFGALDRGMFHTGLRPTDSQADRAKAYHDYVTGALKNPCLVGSHWFQFGDQATTGRGDGENYQIGLINICDRPYGETIKAVREVGSSMYHTRLSAE